MKWFGATIILIAAITVSAGTVCARSMEHQNLMLSGGHENNEGQQQRALEEIEAAEAVIERAENLIDSLENDIPQSATVLFEEAKEHLDNAKEAYDEGRYGRAYGLANSAKRLAQNAIRMIEENQPDDPDTPNQPDVPDEPDDDDDSGDTDDSETTPPRIDVLFLLDSTGSMDDEILVVKDKIEEIIFGVQNGTPKPDVRYAIVTYRDRGDTYVTMLFDFTEDVEDIKTFLRSIQAQGGGDGPESVNEALHVAINDCNWGNDDHVKMVFLIGDAPPHMDYEDDYDYRNEVEIAKEKGIKIHVIGCSGITGYVNGVSIFKEIAEKTNGTYQELIYTSKRDSYPAHDGSTYAVDNMILTWEASSDSGVDFYYAPPTTSTDSVSAGSPPRGKDSNCYSNILDIQLTYVIQQEAIQQGVSYKNAVSVHTQLVYLE